MAAAGDGPARRRDLDAEDLGHPGGAALADDLDADGLAGHGAGDEEPAALGRGHAVACRKVQVLDGHGERGGEEAPEQAADLVHGKADDVVVGALEPGDEGVPDLLDGVGAGLVEEAVLIEIALDHPLGELAEGDVGQVVAGQQPVVRLAVERETGDDPVASAGERSEHGPGVVPAGRLAQDAQAQGDHGVRADDDGLGKGLGRPAWPSSRPRRRRT
ncbi:MAG: hypothetical protein MZV64_43585 [Ignavibacteriales bacterium]|nr:hypothetical protein [Ignavibacteriales bacterium]